MFKRKKKETKENKEQVMEENKAAVLNALILELRKSGVADKEIREKFEKQNYPMEIINYLFKLNEKEVKMGKKEYDEEEFDEDEDDEEEEEDEIIVPQAKKKKFEEPRKLAKEERKEPKVKDEENPLQAIAQAINELNQRLIVIESSLYRIRNA